MNTQAKRPLGRGWGGAAALACCLSLATPSLVLAQSATEGRAQARKAGHLAAQGKCAPAVVAYTKAFEILGDPAILFNRAECLRKLGRAEESLADYERFLVELPNPPNRPLVEQRIDTLRKRLHMSRGMAGKPAAPGQVVATVPQPQPTPPITGAPGAEHAQLGDPGADEDDDEAVAPRTLPSWKPPGAADPMILEQAAEDESDGASGGGWVWVGLGTVVLAAGAVAAFFLLRDDETDIPESRLGNYKF